MANKCVNPFLLMNEDEVSPSQMSSNPFLIDDDDIGKEEASFDNPFMANMTNPFAGGFESVHYEVVNTTSSAIDFFTATDSIPTTAGAAIYSNANENLFNPVQTTDTVTISSFFDTTIHDTEPIANIIQPQKPTELNLKQTHTIAGSDEILNAYSSEDELTNKSMPRRPPPPRPIPPSKETQDTILSVIGHMEQTSTHLLDRIPATRTPSPISMRDLHSPSPTPDHSFAEFLDVDSKQSRNTSQVEDANFFDIGSDIEPEQVDLTSQQIIVVEQNEIIENPFTEIPVPACDINQNQSNKSAPPSRPTLPARPPPARPTPPQKPPPPSVSPHRPLPVHPPKLPVQQETVPPDDVDDFMDMFGDKPSIPQAPKSNKDILSLFSTKTTTSALNADLLSDDISDTEPQLAVNGPTGVVFESRNSPESILTDTESTLQQDVIPTLNPFALEDTLGFTNQDINTNKYIPAENKSNIPLTAELPTTVEPINVFEVSPQPTVFDTEMMSISPEPIHIEQSDSLITQSDDTFREQYDAFGSNPISFQNQADEFDDFSAKFESAIKDVDPNPVAGAIFDPFGSSKDNGIAADDAWGTSNTSDLGHSSGFGVEEGFDTFFNQTDLPAAPTSTPAIRDRGESADSDEAKDFSVFIRPMHQGDATANAIGGIMPVLAPPPKSPMQSAAFSDTSPRFNPFDKTLNFTEEDNALPSNDALVQRTDSQETPPTPLFDEDVSQPLEEFPRINYTGEGWEMQLRQPNKKKITGQRFWKKIFIKLVYQGDNPVLQLFNTQTDKDPFQELPLQACYSVSEIGAQQYDTYGKIFTVKLQYIFYKERPGVRPGQVTKAERITNKLSQFAAYAIQGDYQGCKEFGSDLKKLGLPVEHAPQVSQLFKIGSTSFEDMKQFSMCVEEALFKMSVHRDRALNYKMEEVQVTAVDELYVEQDAEGRVLKQIARVRLFFLAFLSGMPDIELGVNDMRRQGKEVVGRHDIIPVITEEWIRLEAVEFHSCVQQDEYEKTRIIKFKPPDACYIELMRFRIRPPKNRELPLQLKAVMCVTGNKVELRADALVPGFASRKLGQVPCEDVMIRFPIPECWIYLFRVEKHFRYGSVKSAHRRTGKIKGIERFLGAVDTLQESLIEVTSGQAKYEHQHRAIVWRMPRLPKEGQGAYTTHQLVCRMALTSYDQIPDQLAEWAYVEFTMPATQASHTTVRSVSLQGSDSDEPPEKYVRYLARHEYKVGIEHTQGEGPGAYSSATITQRAPPIREEPTPIEEAPKPPPDSDSDSDSN